MEIIIPFIGAISIAMLIFSASLDRRWSPLKLYIEKRRTRAFNSQLIDSLSTMSNCMRAGLSLIQAIETVEQELPPPASEEFSLLMRKHRMGVSLEDGLKDLSRRIKGEDCELLSSSVSIIQESGGNLAEIFETIAHTIRERARIRSRVETLTAQGKLQGIVVSALPLAVGFILYFVSPDTVSVLFTSTAGRALLFIFFTLELCGWLIIRRIIAIDV